MVTELYSKPTSITNTPCGITSDAIDNVKQAEVTDGQDVWLRRISSKLEIFNRLSPVQLFVVNFAVSLALLIGKSVAIALTGSLAVLSTVLDGAVDVVSSVLLWYINIKIRRTNKFYYPRGRRNLEHVAILILAVIMSLASVYVISMSANNIASLARHDLSRHSINLTDCEKQNEPVFELPAIVIYSVTVGLKIILYILCRRSSKPSIQAMALDHRNDIISGVAALAFGIIGAQLLSYMDPIGAIMISCFIIISWVSTATDQIRLLTGYRAADEIKNKLIAMTVQHDSHIVCVNEVTAVHHGQNYIVDIDLLLSPLLTFGQSRDLRQTLCEKLRRLSNVDRVYVNIDFDCFDEVTHF